MLEIAASRAVGRPVDLREHDHRFASAHARRVVDAVAISAGMGEYLTITDSPALVEMRTRQAALFGEAVTEWRRNEPNPKPGTMTSEGITGADGLVAELRAAIAYIERRAAELAAPLIAAARAEAAAQVAEVRQELQRQEDLVAELRRVLETPNG